MNGNFNGNISKNSTLNSTNDYCGRNMPYQQQDTMPYLNQRLMTPITSADVGLTQNSSMTPTTLENTYYLAGMLATLVGQRVRVQFLIGTNGPLLDIIGTLLQVGANYIIVRPIETDDLMLCDLYSIKFVTVLR